MKTKPRKYRNLSMKRPLCDVVEAFIEKHPEFGYGSIAHFFEEAGRRRLEELHAFNLPTKPTVHVKESSCSSEIKP
jgi:hypothetical protein